MWLLSRTSKGMPELVYRDSGNRDGILGSLVEISICVSHSWIVAPDWIFQIPGYSSRFFS